MDEENKSLSIPWQELLETLFRRRWTIVGGMILGLLPAVALVAMAAPVYKARTQILLNARPVAGARESMPEKQILTELELLTSQSLIRSVLSSYEEEGNTRWTNIEPRILADRLEAKIIGRSNVVELTFSAEDPEWSARFVNDLVAHHVERVSGLNEQINAQTFFEEQRDLASQRWVEARQALTVFREEQGTKLLSGDVGELRAVLAALEGDGVTTQTQVLQLEAKVEYLQSELTQVPETIDAETRVTESDTAKMVKARILELGIQRSELLSRYTPTSTFVRELDRQIEEARRLLTDWDGGVLAETMTEVNPAYQSLQIDLVKSRAELSEASARSQALESQIAHYQSKLGDLERTSAELERLNNELSSAKETVENYRKMEEEARLATAMDDSHIVNVIIAEKALKPLKPEPSKAKIHIAMGAVAGLLLGVLLSYLRDWTDPTVKSSAQALRLAGVPVLAEIPLR